MVDETIDVLLDRIEKQINDLKYALDLLLDIIEEDYKPGDSRIENMNKIRKAKEVYSEYFTP